MRVGMEEKKATALHRIWDAKGTEHCFVILNKHDCDSHKALFLPTDQIWFMQEGATVLDLLVQANIFPSKGQARKNWARDINIPDGWSVIDGIGKRAHALFVYKPMHDPDCPCDENNFVEQGLRAAQLEKEARKERA